MRVRGLWYGGSNYAAPDGRNARDWEPFDSLKDAIGVFQYRAENQYRYPCVDRDTTELHVYFAEEYHENGPDRILWFGPRGGVRVERG